MKLKVLVTGGAGNIGLAVLDQLALANIKTALFDLPQQIEMNRALINADTEVFQGSVLDKSSLPPSFRSFIKSIPNKSDDSLKVFLTTERLSIY